MLAAAGFIAAVLIGAWILDVFARAQFDRHARDEGALALAAASIGETLYGWQFRERSDIVAERVFGAANDVFDDSGLTVESNGDPFEIGLRLPHLLSLHRIGSIFIDARAEQPSTVKLILRERLADIERTSNAFDIAGSTETEIDFNAIVWRNASGDIVAAPNSSAMLRFQFSVPRGAHLHLKSAHLARPKNSLRLDLNRSAEIVAPPLADDANRLLIYRLPFDSAIRAADLASSRIADTSPPPLILLPERGRVEQKMALMRDVGMIFPDAIFVPEPAIVETIAQARQETVGTKIKPNRDMHWGLIALYGAIMLMTRYRPPAHPRLRALCEVVLTLIGPMWLIIGGHFDGSLHQSQIVVIAMTFVYVVTLSAKAPWRWNGSIQAWLWALAVVGLACAIGLLLHRVDAGVNLIGFKPILRYAGWALLQQYILCIVCTERWRIVTGRSFLAIYMAAFGFALLHSPNAALMIATFIGGLCWCSLYLRERALLPLAASHALSALTLLFLLPPDILHSAEVSARFFF